MNGSQRFPCQLATVLLAGLGAAAWTARAALNDTGLALCFDGSSLVACTAANTGDTAAYPRQDGRFGRDAAAGAGAQPKTGGGVAGFDFSKMCMSGQLAGQGTCPAAPTQGTGTNEWACTKDNVTNLIWSLDDHRAFWVPATVDYPAVMNATNRCGFGTGWRAPTVRELLSIVNNATYSPAIDANYFPGTHSEVYWSVDPYLPNPSIGWLVDFSLGQSYVHDGQLNLALPVRLVRSGP